MANLLGEFLRQPLILGLVFHVISIVCLRRTLDKIHNAKFFAHGKTFTHRKIKSGRKSLVKKKRKRNSSRLASIFRTRRSSSNQNLPYIILKTRSPFIYASTSLDTNRNFERCLSIRCLAPQHIFLFFHFSLWRLCPLLRRPTQSSTERSSLQWVSFPGKS